MDGCTTWMLTKRMEKKIWWQLHKNAASNLNKSWRQHPQNSSCTATYLPSRKQSKLDGHYWRIRDKLISDVLQWGPSHGRAKAGQPARTNIQQLCEDTGVTLYRWPAKQTIPFLFWRETRQRAFGLEISAGPEVVTGRERELVGKRGWQAVGDGTRTEAVDSGHRSREARQHEIGSSHSERRSSQEMSAFQLLCGIFASNPC